jgi:RNA polymerase sigma-70 factor (ECF subfamily)
MPETSHTEEFVRLLTESQRQLFVYILSLVGNNTDADEVLQEANLVLWRKASEFTPGTNFAAWSMKVAYFEVLAFRKRRQHDQLRFDPDLIDLLAADAAVHAESIETRRRALATCMLRLSERDRELLRLRYGLGGAAAAGSVGELAKLVGRTAQATHQALHRIRTSLLDCIGRRLTAEERS